MSHQTEYTFSDWQAYQTGQMTSEQAHNFERWMLENPTEADAFEGLASLSDTEREQGGINLNNRVDDFARQKESRPKRAVWLGLAATVTAFLLVNWWILRSDDNGSLFNQYYQAYEMESGTLRGEASETSDVLQLYANQEYQACIDAISKVESKNLSAQMALTEALCYMALGEYQKALPKFPETGSEPLVNETSGWYKALTYLKLGHLDACKTYLKRVVKQKGFYAVDAKKLLHDLE